jgi:hypothetical protein
MTQLIMHPDDFHTQDHWSKTRKGRAKACSLLGFEACINQSTRQVNQRPSDTVLDNALSAILGAIWLDCEGKEQTTAMTRGTIWGVLRRIDVALISPLSPPACERETLPPPFQSPETIDYQPEIHTGDPDLLLGQEADPMEIFVERWFDQELGGISNIFPAYERVVPEPQAWPSQAGNTLVHKGFVWNDPIPTALTSSTDHQRAGTNSDFQFQNSLTQCAGQNADWEGLSSAEVRNSNNSPDVLTTRAKRKRSQSKKEKTDSTYQDMLVSERQKLNHLSQDERQRLSRFLEHPRPNALVEKKSNVLHFLWLAIGSWQTISNFRNQLQLARNATYVCEKSNSSIWGAAETYAEICRLDNEESLTVLLRRYHAIKLCEEESTSDGLQGYIMVETPNTIVAGGRSTPGNPGLIRKACRTDELVFKILPNVQRGSKDFKKARTRVKQLRKLATHLSVLVNSYGLGILALLPSGASFGELSLTDNMYVWMRFNHYMDTN